MKTWRWMLTMVAAGSLLAACTVESTTDDDDGTSGSGGDGGSATTGTTGTGVVSSSSAVTSSSTGGNMTCFEEGTPLDAPGMDAETAKGDCSAAQISTFFEACFNNNGDCNAFQMDTANDACLGCMFGGGGGTHFPPMLFGNENNGSSPVYVNVYACESIATGQPQCAEATADLSHCVNTVCETCPEGTGGQASPEETACRMEAETGICSQITIPAGCESVLQTAIADLSPECGGQNFGELYTSVTSYICGGG